jgi:hypothetical protein
VAGAGLYNFGLWGSTQPWLALAASLLALIAFAIFADAILASDDPTKPTLLSRLFRSSL